MTSRTTMSTMFTRFNTRYESANSAHWHTVNSFKNINVIVQVLKVSDKDTNYSNTPLIKKTTHRHLHCLTQLEVPFLFWGNFKQMPTFWFTAPHLKYHFYSLIGMPNTETNMLLLTIKLLFLSLVISFKRATRVVASVTRHTKYLLSILWNNVYVSKTMGLNFTLMPTSFKEQCPIYEKKIKTMLKKPRNKRVASLKTPAFILLTS